MSDSNIAIKETQIDDVIQINDFDLSVKEYQGERVVTFKDIDEVHGRPDGTARKRFNDNREHFIEGVDYYKVCVSEIRTHKIMDISSKAREDITLLTESGYLMLVKSFTDDIAWSVQRQLVNSYFRVKQIISDNYILSKEIEELRKTVAVTVKLLQSKPMIDVKSVNTWKKYISTPLVENISELSNMDIAECYKLIYAFMERDYGFCEAAVLNEFNTKYDCENCNVSTINAIANSPVYQTWFVQSAYQVRDIFQKQLAEDFNAGVIADKTQTNNETLVKPIRKFSVADDTENIIAEVAEYLEDRTDKKIKTRHRIYSEITSPLGWKHLKTRYHCKTKRDVIDKVDNYKKKFVKICNEIINS